MLSALADNIAKAVAEHRGIMVKLRNPQPVAVHSRPFQKGLLTMKSTMIKIAAVAGFIALAGCTDLKPLQADIDSLKSQVGSLSSDVTALKNDKADKSAVTAASSAASSASSAASAASAKADAAQSTANQALSAAQTAQAGVNDLNEKIDRMFKRSVSK
jgi:outer membrane murein-binding lipoprotein Lpp